MSFLEQTIIARVASTPTTQAGHSMGSTNAGAYVFWGVIAVIVTTAALLFVRAKRRI